MKDYFRVKDKTTIKKVLIIAPNWIGDAVLSLPAIACIRELFPASSVTILGLPHICELFKESPYADERMIYSGSLLSTVSDIKKSGFDLAILLPNSFRTALIVQLAHIPYRCGYSRDGRGVMLNIPVKVTKEIKNIHQVEYYRNIVSSMVIQLAMVEKDTPPPPHPLPQGEGKLRGIEMFPPPLTGGGEGEGDQAFSREHKSKEWLYISRDELQHANEIMNNYNISSSSLIIGINPGAAYGSAKRWFPERFALLSRTLVNKHNAKVIIFGSQQELGIATEIENLSKVPVINMAGKTTIRELMSLIKQCSVFITNDSGPMHIAAALNIQVVAVFGSTDPEKTGPMGEKNIVIRKDVDCSPCFKRKCPTDLKCMDLITVEDVLEGVEKILG